MNMRMVENSPESPKNNLSKYYQDLSEFNDYSEKSFDNILEKIPLGESELPVNDYEPLKKDLESRLRTIIGTYEQFFSSIGCKQNIIELPTAWKYRGVRVSSEIIVITLDDGDKFVSFLKSLSSDTGTDDKESLKNLLLDFIWHLYDWSGIERSKDDSYIELVRSAPEIEKELARIDPEKFRFEIEDLQKITKAVNEKYIWEYVEAVRNGLLFGHDSPTKNSLCFHHADPHMTGDELEKNWKDVLKALDFIYKNDRARDLYEIAKTNVLRNLKTSVKEIEDKAKSSNIGQRTDGEKWLPAIKKIERIFDSNY